MKSNLLFLFLLLGQLLTAQTFTEVPSSPPFTPVYLGSDVAFSDVDGDGDSDVLITGGIGTAEATAKLYTNDGNGNFREVAPTPFIGVVDESSVAFSDVDGDGDSDVLIMGLTRSGERISKLYTNSGGGSFFEVTGTPFVGVERGSAAFSDVDGDGDSDVLITGRVGIGTSKLYINNGVGNFTEATGTTFDGVERGSAAFSDVDGDGDSDVLITGNTGIFPSLEATSKLYTNDGMGNFTEVTNTPFVGVSSGSVAFSDVDGDGYSDVLITGKTGSELIAKLYANDGMGNFTEVTDSPFVGVSPGSVTFSDVDGDGDSDVLITGNTSSFLDEGTSKLYSNDGMGNFTEVTNSPFIGVINKSVAFSDVDGDGDSDVLIMGSTGSFETVSKLYTNDGTGSFSEIIGIPFTGVGSSSVAFSDVDGDGDDDVLITGFFPFKRNSKLYLNDGMGSFRERQLLPFVDVDAGSVAFSDVDGDGDDDVLITGSMGSFEGVAKLYTNNGLGNFTEVTDTPFEGVFRSSVAFSDVDGDGDSDVLITGETTSGEGISILYANDGMGNFIGAIDTPFDGVASSSVAFSDMDGDGDSDVLITGRTDSGQIAKLYTNDGMGNFTEVTDTPFIGVSSGTVAFSDVDGDGNSDVLVTGRTDSGQIAKLYTNDGMGNFTEVTDTPFIGVWGSSVAFSDVDDDGDSDVLITGETSSEARITKLYTNDGMGNFSELTDTPFPSVIEGSVAFSDVDGDGDSDVLITGRTRSFEFDRIAKLYTNDGVVSSINKLESKINLTLFPNPADEYVRLSAIFDTLPKSSVQIQLSDQNGRILKQESRDVQTTEFQAILEINDLPSGIYYIQLRTERSIQTEKFLKM